MQTKKQEFKVPITIYLPISKVNTINNVVRVKKQSRTGFIEKAIDSALKHETIQE